jgi:hypothetical protein
MRPTIIDVDTDRPFLKGGEGFGTVFDSITVGSIFLNDP